MVILAPTQQGICLNPAVQDTCAFYSAGICKFPKDCSFSHKKVEDMISLKKEMSEMKSKYSSAIKTAYDFFGSQYVQRYTSQLIMYVLYTEIGHSVRK